MLQLSPGISIALILLAFAAGLLLGFTAGRAGTQNQFQLGYGWAKERIAMGVPATLIEMQVTNGIDFDDFDRGALAYIRDTEEIRT